MSQSQERGQFLRLRDRYLSPDNDHIFELMYSTLRLAKFKYPGQRRREALEAHKRPAKKDTSVNSDPVG